MTGHVRMGESKIEHKVLVGKTERKRSSGMPRRSHISLFESSEIVNSTVEQLNRDRNEVVDAVKAMVDTCTTLKKTYEEILQVRRIILKWI